MGTEGFVCRSPPQLERIKDWNIGTLERWNDGMMKNKIEILSFPLFQYSIVPGKLRGVDHHEEFGLLIADVAELVYAARVKMDGPAFFEKISTLTHFHLHLPF